MPNLRPFRDYSEHEVINLFACNVIANKGTLVMPVRSWKDDGSGNENDKNGPLKISNFGPGKLYTNSISNNFELVGTVTTASIGSLPNPIGILLKDVREFDENGKKLIFDSRKAAEMDVVIKDVQAVPILTRGLILVNDIDETDRGGGGAAPVIGDPAYVGPNGRIATDGGVGGVIVGTFLSKKDDVGGYTLVKINII